MKVIIVEMDLLKVRLINLIMVRLLVVLVKMGEFNNGDGKKDKNSDEQLKVIIMKMIKVIIMKMIR